jgi:hypothetical protein
MAEPGELGGVSFSQFRYDLVDHLIEPVSRFSFGDTGLPGHSTGELYFAHRMLTVATGEAEGGDVKKENQL